MTVYPRVLKASPEDNCRYRVEFTVDEGQTFEPGCWFAWANPAQLKSGDGWVSHRAMGPDAYAKKAPEVTVADGYQIPIEGHNGTYWCNLTVKDNDFMVKLKIAEPIQSGRYMARIIERKSNHGGTYLSGLIEPWQEMVVPEMTANDYRMAQVTANATGGPVEVATTVVEPIGSVEAQQKRIADLKAQLKAAEIQQSVDAAFPEIPRSQATKLPF